MEAAADTSLHDGSLTREQIIEKLGLPPGAKVTLVNLDDFKKTERLTCGWTDDQIRKYPMDKLNQMIQETKASIRAMNESIAEQKQRVHDYKKIKTRKKHLD